ncbi:uncharacterized protein LOC107615054 [Arachis ipaensis]|uniref:uncharacterized protein LOC107615054 n=1 Tax=Arachis ipaensis TaxID=130454 RepID=UPI0007AFBFD3|nr:uncharacterized protein LOC107615054 [Arachis ipaensis]
MEVGNGRNIRFWEDTWLQGGSLRDCFSRLFSVSNQQGSVIGDCGFWDGLEWVWDFQWRRELFQWELELLNQLQDRLRVVRLSVDREDTIVWKFDKNGVFSTSSFVQVLQQETLSADIMSYNFKSSIWRGLVPPRVELFAWFVLVGRVNTKERLSRLGIINHHDNICVLCKKDIEFVHHLFFACEFTWQVWCAWLTFTDRAWTTPEIVKEFFESWTGVTCGKSEQKKWLIGFYTVI